MSLSIALPNGSLEKGTFNLFTEARFPLVVESRKHTVKINSPFFSNGGLITRPQRIPNLVARKARGYDLGICGWDCVMECGCESKVVEVAKLNFSRKTNGTVKIVLFVDRNNPIQSIDEIRKGTEILTEYPKLTKRWFKERGIKVKPIFSAGATESDIPNGYQLGVCVSETGRSLIANGFKVVETICESSTVLIANNKAMQSTEKADMIYIIKKRFLSVLDAIEVVDIKFNIERNLLDQILNSIPILNFSTICPLLDDRFCAVNIIVPVKDVDDLAVKIMKAGATKWSESEVKKIIYKW